MVFDHIDMWQSKLTLSLSSQPSKHRGEIRPSHSLLPNRGLAPSSSSHRLPRLIGHHRLLAGPAPPRSGRHRANCAVRAQDIAVIGHPVLLLDLEVFGRPHRLPPRSCARSGHGAPPPLSWSSPGVAGSGGPSHRPLHLHRV